MWKEAQGLRWLESRLLADTRVVNHGFTTRLGGVSHGEYTALNLGQHVGDDVQRVEENRHRLADMLGVTPVDLIHGDQVHGDRVAIVHGGHRGRSGSGDLLATDALCTNQRGLVLMVLTADCVPILMLDPVRRAIATCHAGWKGTVAKIAQKAVATLVEEYGTDPRDLLVAVGPSIGPCCYPVGENVLTAVRENFPHWGDQTLAQREGQWTFDLWSANRLQLQDSGVLCEHIEITGWCTSCHHDLFYSYRAEQGHTGRLAGVIALR